MLKTNMTSYKGKLEFREEIKLCFPTVIAGFRAALVFATYICVLYTYIVCNILYL